MRTIHKYALEITDRQTVTFPSPAVVLDVQFQDGKLVLWAVVDTDGDRPQTMTVRIFGTGAPFDGDGHTYLSTVQDDRTSLVWHVFGRGN